MQVTFNHFNRQQSGINIQKINQKAYNDNNPIMNANKKDEKRTDTLSLNPFKVNKNNILETLMEQKQNVMEQKYKLIGNQLEKGGSMEAIETQIELFDEQLKSIEEQISNYFLEQSKDQVNKPKEELKKEEVLTQEEFEQKEIADITKMSTSVDDLKIMTRAKANLQSEEKILKGEIKLDQASSLSGQTSSIKESRLEKISGQLKELGSKINDSLSSIGKDVIESKDPVQIEEAPIDGTDSVQSENTASESAESIPTDEQNA